MMSTEYKRIQQRYGDYDDFDDDKGNLLPHEFASVNANDPNTSDGKALYFNFGVGNTDCKRILMDGEVDAGDIEDDSVTEAKIRDGAITLAKLGNIFDPIPLEGSHNLVDSGTQAALFNDTARATTVITGNLTTLSTLNTARQNDRIYTYLLAPGTFFTNQPAAYPVKVLFVNTTQIIIGGDGYVFTRDYNSTTETWSTFSCPLRDLEARVTALEEA